MPALSMLPSSPGTYVTRAEATDADDPDTDNAALHYSILEQGSPELFSIHARTGEIRTVHVGLDREVRQHWPGADGQLEPCLGTQQLCESLSQNKNHGSGRGPKSIPKTPQRSLRGLAPTGQACWVRYMGPRTSAAEASLPSLVCPHWACPGLVL